MPELLCHLLGDFTLQNHAMATRKTSSWTWAVLHVALYMLPFLALRPSPAAFAVMAGTHLVIDRFRLARYWVEFWGVGCQGRVAAGMREFFRIRYAMARSEDLEHLGISFQEQQVYQVAIREFDLAYPPPEPAPPFLAVWLLILADNTAHLLINHLALAYL